MAIFIQTEGLSAANYIAYFNFKVYEYYPSWTKVCNKSCIIMYTWITYTERECIAVLVGLVYC